MRELALESLHADGEHLVLVDSGGQQYRLAIDDALRSAVRSDRPYLEAIRAGARSALPPRDIQARLRAGESVESVAAAAGLPTSAIERYESPVLAERAWIVEQTQKLAIGHEVGAPTLGDLVVDRLAARGDTAPITWDARRTPGAPWEVSVAFGPGGDQVATWQVDLQARSLTALDSRSRLLSETDLTDRRARAPFDLEAEDSRRGADLLIRDSREHARPDAAAGSAAATGTTAPAAAPDDAADPSAERQPTGKASATDSLLERLGRARGRRAAPPAPADEARDAAPAEPERESQDGLFPVAPVLRLRREEHEQPAVEGAAESDESTGGAGVEPAAAGSAASEDGTAQETGEEAAQPEKPRSRSRSRRASVPTWDEIVFGSRGD